MSNFQARDAGGTTQNFKASGTGDSGDPFIPEHNVNVTTALPAGDNNIGNVDVASLPALSAGTNNIGDVDVLSLPALPAGSNTIGKVDQGIGGASAWKVDGSGVTQPISDGGGSLTVDGTVTIQDGGSTVSIDDGGGAITVDGMVAASQSGTWTLGANSGVDIGDVTINNASGASAVNIQDGGNSITVDGTVTANAGTGTFATNVSQIGGNAINTGTGNTGTGTQRVVLASDQPTVSITQKPATAGGLSAYRNLDMGSTGANVKSSAGQVFGWFISNKHATDFRFVKLYNKSTTPSSSDTPLMTLAIPPMAGANVEFTNGIAFSSGIGVRATTGVGDSDTGAPSTNDVIVNLLYS